MKLPLGIQHFTTIREEGYAYVDKTEQIHRVVTTGKFYFLSRPRRFGKSLTVSTLHELYTGNRKLFEGLWIEDKWDWERVRPVIWLKFASSRYETLGLKAALRLMMEEMASQYAIELRSTTYDQGFRELIQRLYDTHGKVVLLVDEYDKPIIDYLDDEKKMEAHKAVLKTFYSILKDESNRLELLFITGVSAFSQVSLFSDLNNLTNLTIHPKAATLVGLTEEEITANFAEALRDVDMERLRFWYNGYSWDGVQRVYNPWSLLSFFDFGRFTNFWFQTGTPTFLTKLLRQHRVYQLTSLSSTVPSLLQFNTRRFDPVPILFQTGYLTLAEPVGDFDRVKLTYPNQEVRHSLDLFLLEEYADSAQASSRAVDIREAVLRLDFDRLIKEFNALLSEASPWGPRPPGLAYDHWVGRNEHFFHAIFYLVLRTVGIAAKSEVHTAKGRCDLLMELPEAIVVLEFKLDQPATVAIDQIAERGYLAPYATDPRRKLALGARVGSEEKQIIDWGVVEG